MKEKLIIFVLLLSSEMVWAQEKGFARIPPTDAIQNYLSGTKEHAALFSGKIESPFDNRQFINHAFLGTDQYVKGTLCYNGVVYQDIFMRLDLYRDELTVYSSDKPYHVVLEKEKFNYAVLNGVTIITSIHGLDAGEKYRVLIDDGIYPFVKKYRVSIKDELSTIELKRRFLLQEHYFIYVGEIAYPVKNKNSLLKLFPDRKKELNEYAKQHRLDFRAHFEQSVSALVNHYENMNK